MTGRIGVISRKGKSRFRMLSWRPALPRPAIDWADTAAVAGVVVIAICVGSLLRSWEWAGIIIGGYLVLLARSMAAPDERT